MKKDNLNFVRVTVEKQYDDRDYEVQGVYEFTADIYKNCLMTPDGDLQQLLKNYDVNIISFTKTIFSKDEAIEAEKFFKNKIDFFFFKLYTNAKI